jgi:cation diffusion facilitator family transporter
MSLKVKVARLSIFSNSLLIILKVITGVLSGSVSIISEAIHSGIDLLAAIIAFFAVKISDKPADENHPYGHGKFENISAVIEAVLIFVAAGWIIYEAIEKVLDPKPIESIGIGSLVMFIAAFVNLLVSRKLYKVAKATDSVALEADALHLKTDVYTSLGVALGLLLIWVTKWHILDPFIAILVALIILKESFSLLLNAFAPLLDASLTEDEIKIIQQTISSRNIPYHNLKTRKAGPYRFADVHIEMHEGTDLKTVHDICDEIEEEVKGKIKNIDLNIHVEPILVQ